MPKKKKKIKKIILIGGGVFVFGFNVVQIKNTQFFLSFFHLRRAILVILIQIYQIKVLLRKNFQILGYLSVFLIIEDYFCNKRKSQEAAV